MSLGQPLSDAVPITVGIFAVWSRYWDPDLEQASDVDAEYILTVGVADALHNYYSGCVALEVSIDRLAPSITTSAFEARGEMLRRLSQQLSKIGSSFSSTIRRGRIDAVVFRDSRSQVPRLLVEVKRSADQGRIKLDAARLIDIMNAYDGQFHSDLEGYCTFPVVLSGEAADNPARLTHELQTKTKWLHTEAQDINTKHPAIFASVFENTTALCRKLTYSTVEQDDGTSETIADGPGFVMVPVALRLQLQALSTPSAATQA